MSAARTFLPPERAVGRGASQRCEFWHQSPRRPASSVITGTIRRSGCVKCHLQRLYYTTAGRPSTIKGAVVT
jgi:hypothetical protein